MSIGMKASFAGLIVLLAAALTLAGCGGKSDTGKVGDTQKTMSWDKMPEMTIDLNKEYSATFVTSKGNFTVKLFANEAPVTVNNFIFLVNERFYEGLSFHRIIESYMIMAGDPKGDGTGTPGYTIPDELDTDLKYEPGVLAMMNASAPNTGGSQFFICTGDDAANLNQAPNYSIFGKVASGMDVVQAIAKTPVKDSKPADTIVIESIAIHES
ncbi:peptidylprolyl isomerase [Paenibacillus harenae]|uniref:peptidylprolyl isomerase n=1 Tax=Paenibacillus harenae TaxID=306543 RepID=UPI00279418E1|nr:peptidylprolyl isomerase [Paenibacillus harenae]MDQ0058047.1 cyclophilin family peptidyl-prolyl cis-trans isomerase/predicted small lipoprotein YifL [Paenibacillus harenae]